MRKEEIIIAQAEEIAELRRALEFKTELYDSAIRKIIDLERPPEDLKSDSRVPEASNDGVG